MTTVVKASAEIFEDLVPGEVVKEQAGESAGEVCVQILSRHRFQENIVIPAVPEPLIVWIVSGEAMVEERFIGGDWKANRVVEGDFFLTTATAPTEMRWKAAGDRPFQVMHLYIGLGVLQQVMREVCGKRMRYVALREVSGEKDPVLSVLLEQIKYELMERERPSRLYVQGLAKSLTVHLVRSYETKNAVERAPRGGLQAYKLHKIFDAMARGLAQPFELSRYAALADLSDYHFSRVFKQSTSMSPSTYFIHLRMEKAKGLLRQSDLPILDVCDAIGYASPSHFSHLFRHATGLTPGEYRDVYRTGRQGIESLSSSDSDGSPQR